MINFTPEMCLSKARELCKLSPTFHPSQAFVTTYTDWDNSNTLDFYIVEETDFIEGRIDAKAVSCYRFNKSKSNTWIARSPCEIQFWVASFNLKHQSHTVSFVHPEDKIGVDDIALSFAFNCPAELAIAQVGRRDKHRKLKNKLTKKREVKTQSLFSTELAVDSVFQIQFAKESER